MNALKKFNTTDVTPCVGILLAEKNEQVRTVSLILMNVQPKFLSKELKFIRTSASITVKMMKSIAVNKLMDVVDNDTDITHEKVCFLTVSMGDSPPCFTFSFSLFQFCADLNEYLTNPSKLSKKLRYDNLICFAT